MTDCSLQVTNIILRKAQSSINEQRLYCHKLLQFRPTVVQVVSLVKEDFTYLL